MPRSDFVILLAALTTFSAGALAQPSVPEPRDINLTLDQIAGLSREAYAARLDALLGDGYHGVRASANGFGLQVTYRSPTRSAGPGVCEATEVTFSWAPETTQPLRGDPQFPLPPAGAGSAPLRLRDRVVETVFRVPEAASTGAATGCNRVARYAHFVIAEDAETVRRAAAILALAQRQLASDPGSIELDCAGWSDCADRIRRTSFNMLEEVSECRRLEVANGPPCMHFSLPSDTGPTMAATSGFEVETAGEGRALRIRRLRWVAMMHTS